MSAQIVTDPLKVVTDPLVLKRLAEQGIDKNYVEFFHDYDIRSRGKGRSPFTKTYRDLQSGKRMLVSSGLPMVDAYGFRHELQWQERNGVLENGNNIFHSVIDNGTIRLIVLSDQPYGIMKDTECSYHAQLFINGSEVLPSSVTPLILATDPVNPNYHDNVVLWQYATICRRRIRIIEGRYRERWLIDGHPNGRVEIRHNKSGVLSLKLGTASDAVGDNLKVTVTGDSEIIEASEFDDKVFPVEIGASLTVFPDAHEELASVDGYTEHDAIASWTTLVNGVGTFAIDTANSYPWWAYKDWISPNYRAIRRSLQLFDTSPLGGDANISASTYSIRGVGKTLPFAHSPAGNIYSAAPVSNIALEAGDFNSCGTDPYCDSPITYPNWDITDFNDFVQNATGLAAISKTGVTKISGRESNYDVPNNPPGTDSLGFTAQCAAYSAEQGSGFKPKLVITYSLPAYPGAAQSALISEIIS
ncbi:hypothetical protein LCGC14_0992660 [marine sediment metagenome]|uniref:Uncharacterized protein n=1 Tax=marine sediment metagenome TaxID=412755 RepID=A0A0F9N5G5_9ZZZZ